MVVIIRMWWFCNLVAVLIKLIVECDDQVDKLGVVIKVVTWVWIMWSLCGDQCDHCVVIKLYADIGSWLFATPCGAHNCAHSPRWSLVFIHTIISPHGHYFYLKVTIYHINLRDGFTKKSCCSFGFCPNYPLPPIWTTCTTFLECQKRRFKRHSKWLLIQNSS